MVSIRLQRTGRKGHAQFRMVVQDSRRAPTSGRVVAVLGFYNPHTKEHKIDLEKAAAYLANGAQPSPRVTRFLSDQKVKLPEWVKPAPQRSDKIRHPEKLRRNRPEGEAPAESAAEEAVPAEPKEQEGSAETPAETAGEKAETAEDTAAPAAADEAPDEATEKATEKEDAEEKQPETQTAKQEVADDKDAAPAEGSDGDQSQS